MNNKVDFENEKNVNKTIKRGVSILCGLMAQRFCGLLFDSSTTALQTHKAEFQRPWNIWNVSTCLRYKATFIDRRSIVLSIPTVHDRNIYIECLPFTCEWDIVEWHTHCNRYWSFETYIRNAKSRLSCCD